MNTSSAAILAPLSDDEREAVRLYYDKGADLSAISAETGLSTSAIRAATDRVAAMMTDRARAAAERAIAASVQTQPDRTPPRRRVARPAALPLAHTAPTAVLAEPPLPNVVPATVTIPAAPAPRRVRTVRRPLAKPSTEAAPASNPHPAEPEFTPGTQAWIELATSPAVRRWAVADGWQVPGRGQPLPGAIVLAYYKAHPAGGAP